MVQEFYAAGTRKLKLPRAVMRTAAGLLLSLPLVTVTAAQIVSAIEMEALYQISFWDALIVSSAAGCGAKTLYTEDLNNGQKYGGVEAPNPFPA